MRYVKLRERIVKIRFALLKTLFRRENFRFDGSLFDLQTLTAWNTKIGDTIGTFTTNPYASTVIAMLDIDGYIDVEIGRNDKLRSYSLTERGRKEAASLYGLNENQLKIYSTLNSIILPWEADSLASSTGIPKDKIYRILKSLEYREFIKVLKDEEPHKYRAVTLRTPFP